MKNTVRLPKLGETAADAVIEQWLVQPGDTVVEGQSIVSVETDKVTAELEATATGTVLELLVQPGDEVPTGTPLCIIEG